MIVTDEKCNNPSVRKKTIEEIQSGKTKTEKANENQLKGASFIKDLEIAERLERLKQFNKRSNNDDNDDDDDDDNTPLVPPSTPIFDPPLYYPQSPSVEELYLC